MPAFFFQLLPTLKGDGHFALFGTLEIGHKKYPGVQRAQCWPFPDLKFYGFNREDFVFVRPPGVEHFVLDSDNVWFGRLKLLFSMSVKTDVSDVVKRIDCAYVSFCFEIKLDASGEICSNSVYFHVMSFTTAVVQKAGSLSVGPS